jgi:GT2 family glycosyltransferase/glycosyltransferase involved in cell wall biosynthesis
MLARLLFSCGLELGPESELMPARPDNPDGFWEHLRFVQLNDEVLNASGGAWDLPPLPGTDFSGPQFWALGTKGRLLVESFDPNSIWGWKDPRNCLTLSFWRQLIPALKVVMVVRHPLEVAYSMCHRNGSSYALGLRLWEIYNRRLLLETASEERIVTTYSSWFEDTEAELNRVLSFTGLNAERTSTVTNMVAHDRRHTTFTMEQLIDAGVSDEIVSLYELLLAEASQREVMESRSQQTSDQPLPARPFSGESSPSGDQLAGAATALNFSVPEAETVRRELAWRRGSEIEHKEKLDQFKAHIENLKEELGSKSERLAFELGRLKELENERDRLLKHLADLESRHASELNQARERFLQTSQLLQRTNVRLADFESRHASLTERFRKYLLEMKRLLRLLDQVDEASTRLRRSRRWKLANPFAALVAAATGKPLQGFGHLDKNVEKYRAWRLNHPEMASLADEIQALRPREIATPHTESQYGSAPKSETPLPLKPPRPARPVTFVKHDEIEISIVIPVHNQLDFTHACLAAIEEYSGDIPYEVIVVDDASTDATKEVIGVIPGITYLRTETNSGFVASCNRGAEAARGRYLVFLNNDTTVTAGWLAALLETFECEPEAGLVGSKLIYPDGRLQEAGGIIWRDGSGWNRGKFQDSSKPEYNYMRQVSYCSAASVMIPKDLFANLGGFDSKYRPAYYEDTDLAFKVTQHGSKVLYQPLSTVVHYEGITSGTDTSSGVKRYQDVNRATFANAWADVLSRLPENGDLEAFNRPGTGKRRVLVIDHHLPMTDRDSGSLRMFQILTILCRLGHRITFLPDNLADIPPYGDDLRKRGIEVMLYPYARTVHEYLQSNGSQYEVVILSRCDFAQKHIDIVRQYAPQSRIIFDTVDLHYLRTNREAELTQDPEIRRDAAEKEEIESQLVEKSDETWVVSATEQRLLAEKWPGKTIHVVSNIVDTPGSVTRFSLRQDFLFIGSFQHTPNIDGVLFFGQEILPLVWQKLKEAKFYIIGDKPPSSVLALADERVVVTGLVPDVRPYFDSVKLSIAPLRYGAGVKGKINQSMGFGVPVVATSIAVEGMDLTNRENVLVADSPQEFARALIELYTSPSLWETISEAGVEKTRAFYSRAAAEKQLRRLFSDDQAEGGPANPSLSGESAALQPLASV